MECHTTVNVGLFMGAYFIETRSRERKFLGEFAPGSKSARE